MKRFLTVASLATLLFSVSGYAEWNSDWDSKNKIKINTQGLPSVSEFTVLVRLHSGNFDFATAKPDGSDLRFIAADDKTELKYFIEKYDSTNELAIIWVKLPAIKAGEKDSFITLYSGNPAATPTSEPVATWDSSTKLLFQFSDKTLLKSTLSAEQAESAVTVQKAGLLGDAGVFNNTPFKIANSLPLNTPMTWSAWIKPASSQNAVLFSQGSFTVKIDGQKFALVNGAVTISGGEVKSASWQHVAVVLNAGKATLFVNGNNVAGGEMLVSDTAISAVMASEFVGEMDQVSLDAVARSDDWVKLLASSQGADSKLLVVESGDGEEDGEGEVNYIGILVESLTLDAKVVIAILGVMFAISVWVMVAKAMLVSRTDKDNKKFLKKFQDASGNLLQLDQAGKFKNSSLFLLYMAGIREIRKREVAGQALSLSGASMDAIKAAIDADLVRETQRQNAGMVLLTIAISGGPFLGLLGTVVGVMITFAAIAAAGDVNVNAIAPGIAAALLATVAGLGVAIPALFGYNYLASRVKNITIEMQIFVDEFITRVAELHGK